MGGKNLKINNKIITRRYNKEEYEEIKKEVLFILRTFGYTCYVCPTFTNKESHGDLDVLVKDDGFDRSKLVPFLKKIFKSKKVKNSSLEYKDFQIDLIIIKSINWQAAKVFYSYGDLSNLLGKMVNKYGNLQKNKIFFKWGFDGVKIKFQKDSYTKTVVLSKDPKDIFKFLDLDWEEFNKGFKTKYEMFDFVMKSSLFDKRFFDLDNQRNYERKRSEKRPDYLEFIEYIKDNDNFQNYRLTYEYYLDIISDHFNVDLVKSYNEFLDNIKLNKIIRNKFNGNHIIEHFKNFNIDLDKRLIPEIKDDLKSKISELDWDYSDYILSHNTDEILSLIQIEDYYSD